MHYKKLYCLLAGFILSLSGLLHAQASLESTLNSISKDELRDHIYFLASDFMAGRSALSDEYEIAARYVASQFESAGVEPLLKDEAGELTYFQEVPFIKTSYGPTLKWTLNKGGETIDFLHNRDFKLQSSRSNHNEKLECVFVGYGIEEPDHGWNDFEGMDVKGKMVIVLNGAPMKRGKAVLSEEVHAKYAKSGIWNKSRVLSNKGAKGIMMVYDENPGTGKSWDSLKSQVRSERYSYQRPQRDGISSSRPSMYLIKPEVADAIFEGQPCNPSMIKDKGLRNYSCFPLEGITLETYHEVLEEELLSTKNIIGVVPGTDPGLMDEYITVGAHLDHVSPFKGQIRNGADDNASGSSGMLEIAEAMALNPARRPVVFIAFTAEEMGLCGSDYFLHSGTIEKDKLKFNLNLDMIGRSSVKNAETRAHYLVSNKKYLNQLNTFVGEINKNSVNYPIIFNNDKDSPGGSDHQSFIRAGIPAFFFFSGVHPDLHKPGDDPGKIDYEKAESISRLAYLIANELANMNEVPSFLEE